MISLLKQNWTTIKSVWGNFYLLAAVTIAGLYSSLLLPPLLNGDFLSMAIGGFGIIFVFSIWVTSLVLWIESLSE